MALDSIFDHWYTTERTLGVLCRMSRSTTCRLTDDHFSSVGVSPDIPLAVAGMQEQDEFRQAVLEEKDPLFLMENQAI